MRRLSVRFRPEAEADLATIEQVIAERSGSAVLASRYADRVVSACERIGISPEGSPLRPELMANVRVRSFEKRVSIAYVVEPDAVRIFALFYGGRQVDTMLSVLQGRLQADQ